MAADQSNSSIPSQLGGYWAKAADGSLITIHAIRSLSGEIIFIVGNYQVDPAHYRDWRKIDTGLLDSRRQYPSSKVT
jgi:hypothetical protein